MMLSNEDIALIRSKARERSDATKKRINHLLAQYELSLEVASYRDPARKKRWQARAFDLAETLRKVCFLTAIEPQKEAAAPLGDWHLLNDAQKVT